MKLLLTSLLITARNRNFKQKNEKNNVGSVFKSENKILECNKVIDVRN